MGEYTDQSEPHFIETKLTSDDPFTIPRYSNITATLQLLYDFDQPHGYSPRRWADDETRG